MALEPQQKWSIFATMILTARIRSRFTPFQSDRQLSWLARDSARQHPSVLKGVQARA